MILQEGMNLHPRLETEQLPDVGFRKPVTPISFQSYSFECRVGELLARTTEDRSQIVRNLDRYRHS